MKHRTEKCYILCGRTKGNFLREDLGGKGERFGGPRWDQCSPGERPYRDKDTRAVGLSNGE